MVLLKIQKRDASSINNTVDFNPSVFRYFADSSEIKLQSVKNGLKSAFLGMLDTVVIPDERLFNELGEWSFVDPVESTTRVGGVVSTTNSYNGIRWIFREALTVITPAIPASSGTLVINGENKLYKIINEEFVLEPNLNLATHAGILETFEPLSFWGARAAYSVLTDPPRAAVRAAGFENTVLLRRLEDSQGYTWIVDNIYGTHVLNSDGVTKLIFSSFAGCRAGNIGSDEVRLFEADLGNYSGETYILVDGVYNLEPDRAIATHGKLISDENVKPLAFYGGNTFTEAITTIIPSGFYPIANNEVGTHGMEGSTYRPLAYWNESTTSPISGNGEYKGRLIESKSGFTLDTEKIALNLTLSGEALTRYNPIDLITFVTLIKLQYVNRDSATQQVEI